MTVYLGEGALEIKVTMSYTLRQYMASLCVLYIDFYPPYAYHDKHQVSFGCKYILYFIEC